MYSFLYKYSFVRSPPAGARALRLDGATLQTNSTREQPRASARLLSHFRALGLTALGAITSALYY